MSSPKPVFVDHFNDPASSPVDPALWHIVTITGWEPPDANLALYTDRIDNIRQDGQGNLVIESKKEVYKNQEGVTRGYTSARIHSRSRFGLNHYAEVLSKVPTIRGTWPAWWLFPIETWPPEIDIYEFSGDTYHRMDYHDADNKHSDWTEGGKHIYDASTNFHTYGAWWDEKAVTFYRDRKLVRTIPQTDVVSKGNLGLVLNTAVGYVSGQPDGWNSQTHTVDYVKVWDQLPF